MINIKVEIFTNIYTHTYKTHAHTVWKMVTSLMLYEKKEEKNTEDLLLHTKDLIFILTTIYMEISSSVPPIFLMRKLRLREGQQFTQSLHMELESGRAGRRSQESKFSALRLLNWTARPPLLRRAPLLSGASIWAFLSGQHNGQSEFSKWVYRPETITYSYFPPLNFVKLNKHLFNTNTYTILFKLLK